MSFVSGGHRFLFILGQIFRDGFRFYTEISSSMRARVISPPGSSVSFSDLGVIAGEGMRPREDLTSGTAQALDPFRPSTLDESRGMGCHETRLRLVRIALL